MNRSPQIWYNPETNRYTTIRNHPVDMLEGTLNAILKQADLRQRISWENRFVMGLLNEFDPFLGVDATHLKSGPRNAGLAKPESMSKWQYGVDHILPHCLTRWVAETGVDYISVGANINAVDLFIRIEFLNG